MSKQSDKSSFGREIDALAERCRRRGLGLMETASLGACLTGHSIRALRGQKIVDDEMAEQMLQRAFREVRRIAFPDGDGRH